MDNRFIVVSAGLLAASAIITAPSRLSAEVTNSPSGTYWSLQLDLPPLPYNRFPELPLYDLGNRSYVYDDRGIDYSAVFAEEQAAAAAAALNESGTGAVPQMMSAETAQSLSVGISYNPPSGFGLDVF